jgi:hypothetical protein
MLIMQLIAGSFTLAVGGVVLMGWYVSAKLRETVTVSKANF